MSGRQWFGHDGGGDDFGRRTPNGEYMGKVIRMISMKDGKQLVTEVKPDGKGGTTGGDPYIDVIFQVDEVVQLIECCAKGPDNRTLHQMGCSEWIDPKHPDEDPMSLDEIHGSETMFRFFLKKGYWRLCQLQRVCLGPGEDVQDVPNPEDGTGTDMVTPVYEENIIGKPIHYRITPAARNRKYQDLEFTSRDEQFPELGESNIPF